MTQPSTAVSGSPAYDVFISHASEDKHDVARPLAALLIQAGLKVWLDESELLLGDSLRRKIDVGLASSRFGIVILSKAFFAKEWPQKELDALVAREGGSGKVVLPVWHNISRQEVSTYSPILADRLSASTDIGLAGVAAAVCRSVGQATEDASQAEALAQSRGGSGGLKSIHQLITTFIDRVQENHDAQSEVTGLRTGFYDFDRFTAGLQLGELYVVAARPSVGCTTFALNISEHIATSEGLPVLYFSPRTKSQEVVRRLIASVGRINRWSLATGRLEEGEWERLAQAVERVHETSLYVDDATSLSIEHISERVREKHREIGAVSLVVVDGLDALAQAGAQDSVNDAIHQLWRLARDLNCAVVVTLGLPRVVDTRNDKRPTIADLPNGETIDQYATAVVLLYRDDHYIRDSVSPGVVEVIVARHRGGPTGTVRLVFMRALARMENMSTEEPEGAAK